MKQESGFSVVELTVVIAIITALLLVVGGGWFAFIPGYRLSAAAGDLQGALQLAKLRAIKENAVVTVNLSGGTGGTPVSYVVFVDFDGDGTQETGDIEFLSGQFHPSLSRDPDDSATQIQFNTRGFPLAAGDFLLLNRSKGRGVELNIAGGLTPRQSDNGGASWMDI